MKYGWLALALCGGTLLAGPAFGQESSAGTIELSVQVEGTVGASIQPNSNGSDSQIATATHRQHLVLKPEKDGQPAKLFSFCVDSEGRVLAVCGTSLQLSSYGGASSDEKGFVVAFAADGSQQMLCELPFLATAIATAPNGTIFVAGNGKVASLKANGELIAQSKAPNMGDEKEMRRQAEEGAKKMREQYGAVYEEQINTLKERVAELEKKDADKLSRAEKARLDAYKQQLELYEGIVDQIGISVDSVLAQGLRITAITADANDVYVSCGSLSNSGYAIWRTDHKFENAKELISSVSGCCGQMDLQCCDGGFALAENTSFAVGIYDRDGNKLNSFGKADRSSNNGFGSCCNPMNVCSLPGGLILTAESSVGHIKCFDKEGNFVSYVGRAKIGGGCKHCSIGYDPSSDQYYMMHEDANAICVLGNSKTLPSMTDEEKKIAAIRDQFQDKLLGTWQIGEPAKQPKAKSFGAALASAFGIASDDESETTVVYGESGFQMPWTKAAFMADGGIQTSGGVYGNLEGSYTWSWEVSPESTKDSLKLVIAMDQVEYYTLAVKFGEANKAEFVFTEYGTTHPAVAATRVADCEGKPCGDGDCVEPVTE